MAENPSTLATLECCPPLEKDDACDVLDFRYRLPHFTTVATDRVSHTVQVEVVLHYRLTRCPGPLLLGDPIYSTTLLPGEKVRLFTSDRRTRFTFDSETKLSYRTEQTSEEQFYMSSMADMMSDLTVVDKSHGTNSSSGSFQTHGEVSNVFEDIFSDPSMDVNGSYNAQSTSDFARELTQHASASSRRSEQATRAATSTSIGEVSTRSHAEGESEDHFESSSREFSNPNRCHAVTFLFYRINKRQTIKFTLETVERRIVDPAGSTKVVNNRFVAEGAVSVIPAGVLATDKERLEVESIGRQAGAAERVAPPAPGQAVSPVGVALLVAQFQQAPLPNDLRKAALDQVDKDLVDTGLLDKVGGLVSKSAQQEFSFSQESSIPTPGVIVKGCLDECDVCEPDLKKEIELELKRKELENELLKKQIDLLEKSQEYRCCPEGEEEAPETP